jgi:hypothetical protein
MEWAGLASLSITDARPGAATGIARPYLHVAYAHLQVYQNRVEEKPVQSLFTLARLGVHPRAAHSQPYRSESA